MSKQILLEGINEVCDAIKSTYGKDGKHVLFNNPPRFTLDGVSVAKFFPQQEDKTKQLGIDLIRSITTKTEIEVGDGTTTTAVLAQSLANSVLNLSGNNEIRNGIKDATLEAIKKIKKEEGDYLFNVAVTSCKDKELAQNIVDILKTSEEAEIDIKMGGEVGYIINNGITIGYGYNHPVFAKNGLYTASDCLLYVSEDTLTSNTELLDIIKRAEGKQVVFLGEQISGQALETLVNNNKKLNTCAINVEGAHKFAEIIGSGFVDIKNITVSKDKTIIVPVEDVTERIENSNYTEQEKKAFKGLLCEFSIGGETEEEKMDRFYRVEDAIGSVRSAIKGGVVKGGGQAFLVKLNPKGGEADYILGYKIVEKALQVPHSLLGGGDSYDSYLVTTTALSNAVALAELLLNTEYIYAN